MTKNKLSKRVARMAPPIIKPSTGSSNLGALRLYHATDVVEDKEFKTLLPERGLPELNELESSILKNGVEEPINVWIHENKRIVVDGYTRLKICKKHNIQFQIRPRIFKSREEVKIWIINHQLERRNVTVTERAYLIGYEYHRAKKNPELLGTQAEEKKVGGQNVHHVQQSDNQLLAGSGQNDHQETKEGKEGKVADRLALAHNVNEKTVRRYEHVYLALAHIRKCNDELGLLIAAEKTRVTSSDLENFAQLEEMPEIREEADIKAALKAKPKPVKKKHLLPNLDKNWKRTLSLIGRYDKDPSKNKAQKEALESLEELIAELKTQQQRIKHGE